MGWSAKEIMTSSTVSKNQPFGSRIKTEAFDEAKKITEKNLEVKTNNIRYYWYWCYKAFTIKYG